MGSPESTNRWVDIVFSNEPDVDRSSDTLRISPIECGVGWRPRRENMIYSELEFSSVWFSWKTTCQIAILDFEQLGAFLGGCHRGEPTVQEIVSVEGKIGFELRWLPEHQHAHLSGAFPWSDYFTNWADENPLLLRGAARVRSTFDFWVSKAGLEEAEVELNMFLQQYRDCEREQLGDWDVND